MTRFYRLLCHRSILLFLNDKSEHCIQHACDNQFITGIFPLHFFKEYTDDESYFLIILVEVVADIEGMIEQIIEIAGLIIGRMKQFGRLKYKTFIRRIIGIDNTSVDDSVADKDDISRNEMECFLDRKSVV